MDTQALELKAKLYQKIWAVMGEIDYIRKDGEVKFGESYKYATEAAIKKQVHQALIKHRLVFMPERSELAENAAETITDKYGKPKQQFRSTINLFFTFTDIDTGYSETKSMHGAGSGSDEKSLYKAFTGAFKYIFHLGMVIPTGDDPEKEELSREEKQQAKAEARQAQQQVAERRIQEVQSSAPEVWDWRIALGRFEQLEKKYGAEDMDPYMVRLRASASRDEALALYEEARREMARVASTRQTSTGDEPAWVEAPHQAIKEAADPALEKMQGRMLTFDGRIAVLQQLKYELTQKLGVEEGEAAYYMALEKHGAKPAKDGKPHANDLAKNSVNAKACAKELHKLLNP